MQNRLLAAFQSLLQLAQFHPQWRNAMPHDRPQEQLMFGIWLVWIVQLAWTQPAHTSLGYLFAFWHWLVVMFVAFAGGVVLLYVMALFVARVRHFPVLFDGHVLGLLLSGLGFTLATFLNAFVTPEGSTGVWLGQAFVLLAGLWTLVAMSFVVRTALRVKAPVAVVVAACYLSAIVALEWLGQMALYNLLTKHWPF